MVEPDPEVVRQFKECAGNGEGYPGNIPAELANQVQGKGEQVTGFNSQSIGVTDRGLEGAEQLPHTAYTPSLEDDLARARAATTS